MFLDSLLVIFLQFLSFLDVFRIFRRISAFGKTTPSRQSENLLTAVASFQHRVHYQHDKHHGAYKIGDDRIY